jgi:Putative redox-active protein (C_GCAxxG_C_C)
MNAEESKVSRRSFLTTAGGVAVGLGIAQLPGTANAAEVTALPWPYPPAGLDADAVSEAAYSLYKSGGCGYGSAQSIINALAQALPDPWGTLPAGMYGYANGGVVGWGTICGALNGVLAVMGLLGWHGKLGNALMDYFCTTELPTKDWVGDELVTSVSYSPLCHNSVSKWAAAQGVTVTDPKKIERCARLVGDIVFKAVQLMNAQKDGTTPLAWAPPESYAGCYDCHTSGIIPSQQGKMDCLECHETIPAHGSRRKRKGNSGR